jgi:tyrosine-specific transport protein
VLVMGAVPVEMLENAWVHGDAATKPLAAVLQSPTIQICSRFFSFFAIVTSFVGTTLGLSDFLTDGFKLKKDWTGRLTSCLLTFIPPLIFVYTYERGFFMALQYAGVFVAVLIGILPSAMVWRIKHPFYNSFFGRSVILIVGLACLAVVAVDVLSDTGALHRLLPKGY